MLSPFLNLIRPKRRREHLVREFVDATNRMDYSQIDKFLTEDFLFIDSGGKRLNGRNVYVTEDRFFREAAGQPLLVIESLDHNRGEVLLRGRLDSEIDEVAGPTMWRLMFRDGKIECAEVTRPRSHITLPVFAHRARKASA